MRRQISEKKKRAGYTGRTSNQGRKLASGGTANQRGNQEMDDQTKSPKTRPRPNKPAP